MRWLLLLVALLILPAAHATWYYAGDTFTHDDIIYSVEGSDQEMVLLGAGGHTYLLRLGECVREGLLEYCYVDTAYPSDDAHIKFEAGDVYYGYDITIDEVAPDVDVDREVSEDDPQLNQEVAITVTIANTGEFRITDIRYDELLPSGLVGISSIAGGGKVAYTKNVISPGQVERFTYKVKPTAYGSFTLSPTMRYTSEGAVFNATISKTTIDVASPVTIKRYLTPTLDLEQTGTYAINVTNDGDDDIDVKVAITKPSGAIVGTPSGAKISGSAYVAEDTLGTDDAIRISLPFTADNPGKHIFSVAITTTQDGIASTVSYNDTVTSTAEGITPSIGVSPVKTTYPAGSQMTLTGVLKNDNDDTGFRKVQATLSVPGAIAAVSKDQGALGAGDTVTLFTERFGLPNVTNQTSFTAKITGTYETNSGKRYEFSTTKVFNVAPVVEALTITRTLDPKTAPRGGNMTITVSAKNVYGAYATIDTHERFPEGVVAVSGLTYAEISLERDATQQLYIYQIAIPEEYPSDTLEIVTVARVQGQEEPQESSTVVTVSGTPPGNRQEEAAEPTEAENEVPIIDVDNDGIPDDVDDDIQTPGVFTRMWTWLKGVFS